METKYLTGLPRHKRTCGRFRTPENDQKWAYGGKVVTSIW